MLGVECGRDVDFFTSLSPLLLPSLLEALLVLLPVPTRVLTPVAAAGSDATVRGFFATRLGGKITDVWTSTVAADTMEVAGGALVATGACSAAAAGATGLMSGNTEPAGAEEDNITSVSPMVLVPARQSAPAGRVNHARAPAAGALFPVYSPVTTRTAHNHGRWAVALQSQLSRS